MVRRSACRGSKSVDARTISSPTRQPAAFSTCIEVLPAFAVLASLVQVLVRSPCRFRVPPMGDAAVTAVIRSTHATDIFVFDVVGEGNGRLARVGFGLGANLEFPVQQHPLG